MEKVLDKEQVLAQLDAKSEDISRRLDAIQNEVSSTGQAVKTAVVENPLLSVGASIAAGLLAGLLFGGSRKKPGVDVAEQRYRALIDDYIQSIADEAQRGAKAGRNGAESIRQALKDRVPLIVYSNGETRQQRGLMAESFDLVYKTALGFAVKFGIDYLTAKFDMDTLADHLQAEEGTSATPSVAAAVSED